jgi:RNA polymerase sigma-70 factor (ECF subfamily)
MLAALLNDQRRLADDLAQDVFVEAFRRLPAFDASRSRFSTWLFMIARSRGINALKRKRPELFPAPPEAEAGGADAVNNRADLVLVDRAVQQLPEKQRRAFLFAVVEELPYAEIACIEATTVGTIKSRVSRAREFLKATLDATQR